MSSFTERFLTRVIGYAIRQITALATQRGRSRISQANDNDRTDSFERRYFGMYQLLCNINPISEALYVATGATWYLRICDHGTGSTVSLPDGLLFYNDELGLLLEVMTGETRILGDESFVTLKRGSDELLRIGLDSFVYVPVMKAVSEAIDVIHADYLAQCRPWQRLRAYRRIRYWRRYRKQQQFVYYDEYVAALIRTSENNAEPND